MIPCQVLPLLDVTGFGIDIPVAVGIRREIEALLNEMSYAGLGIDIPLVFKDAEVFSVEDNHLWPSTAVGGGHDIIPLSSLGVRLVGLLSCLSELQ